MSNFKTNERSNEAVSRALLGVKQQPAYETERTFSYLLFWIIGLKDAGFFFLVPFYLHHSHNNKMFRWPCLHPENNSYISTVPFKEKGSTYFHLHFKNLLQN